MTVFRRILVLGCMLPALGLAACGEGWEVVKFQGQVPYTEERTAGAGVSYVRAYMLPEKGPVLEPKPTLAAPPPVLEKVDDAQPLFNQKQLKK
jgi:hypothetical protein